jgi:hypothetical protein
MSDPAATFHGHLLEAYTELFKCDANYRFVGTRTTPADLARDMVQALAKGSASLEGEGIKRACRAVGIKPTRKAVMTYLNG